MSGWVNERLIAFVVAEPAIAEHVDDHRLVELLPELDRDLRGIDDGFGIVAIDVNDRRLDHFRGIRRIGRRPRMARRGGEADLIVDDEMDRPAGPVSLETGEAETFGDHALSRESRVAMDEQAAGPSCARRHRAIDLAWRAPCRGRRDRRSRDATDSRSAKDGRLLLSKSRSDEAPR